MNVSKGTGVLTQIRWTTTLWAVLSFGSFLHIVRHYWDAIIQGDIGSLLALNLCAFLIVSSFACWRQLRWRYA